MKQFFTLMFFFLCIGSVLKAQNTINPCQGQINNSCDLAASNISSVATKIETVDGNCVTTVNITFDLRNNGGIKWVPIYFYDGAIPAGVCGTTPNSTTGLMAFALLENIGNGSLTVFRPSTTPFNGLTPQTGYKVSNTDIIENNKTVGSRIVITGLKFSKPGACVTSQTELYVGADNSNTPVGISCYSSGKFTAYQLFVSGRVNCSNPLNPSLAGRSYDLIIDSDYKGAILESVQGNYEVYVDANNNGSIDAGEMMLTSSTEFSTAVEGINNRFTRFLVDYSSVFTNGDPSSSKNLLVKVTPTTSGLAQLVGRLVNTCGTLPVTLKSFQAKLNNNAVALTWETADELSNKGFEIQRRLNGAATYEKIGFVESKASLGLGASYSFVDANARNRGSVAYRLAQTDLDGKISLSEVRIVNTGAGNSQILVYPNPSKGAVKVSLPVQNGKADISLEDFSGKTIQRWNAYAANTLQIDQIRPGIYLIRVRLQETGEQMIERLIVQ